MKPIIFCLFLIFLGNFESQASVFHRNSSIQQEWKEDNLLPFDELIFSWNAKRPIDGKFLFYIKIKTDDWSPWLLYASWGSDGQSSFSKTDPPQVKVYQDIVEVMKEKKATAFQVKIITEGKANLSEIYGLHVYTNGDRSEESVCIDPTSVYLKVSGISQMMINHPRFADLCSPTSTTAVVRFLSKDDTIDPAEFAINVWDAGFDIFGNWVFNVAQAATLLDSTWNVWIDRLSGFDPIYRSLLQGIPVVVSVRGPLIGSASPYAKGHLMAVIGYDAIHQQVICMDPAFPKDQETHVRYPLADFLEAWSRRGNIAYMFSQSLSAFSVQDLTLEEKVGQLLMPCFRGVEANEDAKMHRSIVSAVKSGRIAEERINQAVEHVLSLKKNHLPRYSNIK